MSKVIVIRVSIMYVAGAVIIVIVVLTITITITVISTNFGHPCLPSDGQSQRPVFA